MSKNVVKYDDSQLLPQAAAKGRGFDHEIDKDDYVIPRAKLLQPLSPEVAEDGMKSGEIINSLTKEVLPGTFIPLYWFPTWLRFNARKPGERGWDSNFGAGALIWRSKDPNDERVANEGKFGPDGEVPLATKFLNFFSIFPSHSMPVIVSFSKTSMKAGKRLLTLARMSGGDMFSRRYDLSSKLVKGDQGTYHVLEITPVGLIPLESKTFKTSEVLYENFKERPIDIHEPETAD